MNQDIKKLLLIAFTGILALAMGIWGLVSDRTDAANDTVSATAEVVSYETGEEYSNVTETYDTVYYPVVSYEVNGETITSRYSQSYTSEKYNIGEKIEIKYNPDDPASFIVDGEHRGTFNAVWMIPLGVILLGLFAFRLIAILKLRKASA